MIKNTQWDIKTKIKTALIIFFAVLAGIAYEGFGSNWTSPKMVVTIIAASVAFAAMIAITVDAKALSLKSIRGIAILVMLVYTFTVVVSHDHLKHEALLMLLFAPLMLICSQFVLFMPVAAVIAWYLAVKHGGVAVMCLPAAVGASLVCLSAQVKVSPLWKKILFAVSELAVIAATVWAIYDRRYFLTTYAFVTEIWDSLGILVADVIFVALAVASIKRKRPVGEIFGYISSAASASFMMFMSRDYALTTSCTMLMAVSLICQEGLPAEEIGNKVLKSIGKKLKK